MATRKPKVIPKDTTRKAGSKEKAASDTATKQRAKKATAAKEKTSKEVSEIVILPANTFVKFTGYVNETPDEDRIFEKGDTLVIVAVHEATEDSPPKYECIRAADYVAFLENPDDENIDGQELAVQEVQALTGRALAEANDNYLPIPSVGELEDIIQQANGDLLAAAETTFGKIEQSFFYLGGLLARIKREGIYLKENGGQYEGETAWDDFCQAEFGFSGAKGGDLARMYATFAAIPNFDPSKLSDIGWSKVREIQRYVTEDNYENLIEDARNMTREELKTSLVTKYVDESGRTPSGAVAQRTGGRNAIKTITLNFKLVEENATAVQLALAEAKKLYGVESDAEALARIIMAWAEEHVASATKQKRITAKIVKAEKDAA
jgi:hypothetical protein